MRPKGSAAELEVRRRRAVALLQKGLGNREVARMTGAASGSVTRWQEMYRIRGPDGLKANPHPGPKPRLHAGQKKQLASLLLKGPTAYGHPTALWTLERIAQLIRRRFGVKYHPDHVWRILDGMGWSCQKPERRARERDETAIQRWRQHDWPRIKKTHGATDGQSSC